MIIEVIDLNGMKLLMLYNIAYISGFFINLISAKRAKWVNIYINMHQNILYKDNSPLYLLTKVNSHWYLK